MRHIYLLISIGFLAGCTAGFEPARPNVLTNNSLSSVNPTPSPTPTVTSAPSGSPLIIAPLNGATPGKWQLVNYAANGISTNYLILLPYNYSAANSYPLLVYLHENGYGGDGTGQFLLYEYESQGEGADIWFNNSTFRTNWPAIVVCPLLIEDQDDSGNTQNWGGWGGAKDSSTGPDWDPGMLAAYGGKTADGSKAPGNYYYLNDSGLDHDVWYTYRNLTSSFGSIAPATKIYNWLFSQTSPVAITISK